MFDAKLMRGDQMKKIVTALKELIEHASWDLTDEGVQLQSMDSSHVALVQMMLKCENFEYFRCDEAFQMGLNMANLNKIFGAFTSGSVQIQSEDDSDTVKYIFADEKTGKNQKYELRLMDLDVEQLGIPEQDYQATFTMPSNEFTKIVKDLLVIGESVTITVTKGDVMFRAEGDIGKGDILLKKNENVKEKKSKKSKKGKKKPKKEKKGSDEEESEEEKEESEESEEESSDDEEGTPMLELDVKEQIELSFATQYLKKFTAAGPLAKTVSVSLSKDVPMVISYEIEDLGHLKYFLAPKIDDDEEE